jgi:hypothetical protein
MGLMLASARHHAVAHSATRARDAPWPLGFEHHYRTRSRMSSAQPNATARARMSRRASAGNRCQAVRTVPATAQPEAANFPSASVNAMSSTRLHGGHRRSSALNLVTGCNPWCSLMLLPRSRENLSGFAILYNISPRSGFGHGWTPTCSPRGAARRPRPGLSGVADRALEGGAAPHRCRSRRLRGGPGVRRR